MIGAVAGLILFCGSLGFALAFGAGYLLLTLVLVAFGGASVVRARRGGGSKVVNAVCAGCILLLVGGFFAILNTVFLLRVGTGVFGDRVVISELYLALFYAYAGVYLAFVVLLIYWQWSKKKGAVEEEDASSSITYRQLITASATY